MNTTKMIWEGAIAVEMVNGWTDEAINNLQIALNEAVEETFSAIEQEEIDSNPLLRLVLDI